MPSLRFLVPVVALAFALSPSARAELGISGVEPDIERNIRAFASLSGEPCDSGSRLIRRRFRVLESESRKALEPFGHYEPIISSELTLGDDCWRATLTIDPGEPVRYRNVDIVVAGAAASDPAFEDLARPRTLVPGAVLRHADYENLKKVLQVRAADRGYVEARFVQKSLEVWPDLGAADVSLHFDSGPRYRIGEILVEQSFLDPTIVDGYLDLERGVPYDNADLAKAQRDLADSAYFGDIRIRAEIENAADGEIPIRIALEPGTRIEYTVGVGASTDTGARFRTGVRNNRVNASGHRLVADLGVSSVLQGLTLEYRIPLHDPRREWFSLTGAASNEETDTFDNEAQRFGIRWTKSISDKWLRTLSLDASNESFNVGQNVDTTRLILPAIAFDQKVADKDVFPTRGRRIGADLRGTDEAFGSTTSFVQVTAWLRWIRSFGDKNRLLARLNAGVTHTGQFAELPPSIRFFAGGDQSVRGYKYESLGPKDDEGNVIGGNNLLTASIELERHLRGNFFGAVFVDAGNAFDETNFEPEVGAGIGLKWRSPLGPLRFYLGYPVTADDKSVRLHLMLGAEL